MKRLDSRPRKSELWCARATDKKGPGVDAGSSGVCAARRWKRKWAGFVGFRPKWRFIHFFFFLFSYFLFSFLSICKFQI
jgi:hypothetical protein